MINSGSSQDLCALCFVFKKKINAPFWLLKNQGVTVVPVEEFSLSNKGKRV
jgi:hypothetical protein